MSVTCTQCSRVLPDRATVCWQCGYVRRSATEGDGSVAYEACEIVYGPSSRTGELVFWARATGASGTYAAAEPEALKRDETGTYLVSGTSVRPASAQGGTREPRCAHRLGRSARTRSTRPRHADSALLPLHSGPR